jgi:hypothetical protein
MRQYVGGDAHHLRQRFPRVVLRDIDTFCGFLDGYADGDGFRHKRWAGRTVGSANVPFLAELATVIGARFTPSRPLPGFPGQRVSDETAVEREGQAVEGVPGVLSSSSSGRRQTRSRKRADAMTAMAARTEKPA